VRALLALALVATTAHADDLTAKLVTAVETAQPECLDLLAGLRDRGDSLATEVRVREYYAARIPQARRPVALRRERVYSLRELYAVCGAQARRHAVEAMRMTIVYASQHPGVWREACIEQWPKALARGVRPTERYLTYLRKREHVSTSLEAAYTQYCGAPLQANR
jgi:hypothetical protein